MIPFPPFAVSAGVPNSSRTGTYDRIYSLGCQINRHPRMFILVILNEADADIGSLGLPHPPTVVTSSSFDS